MRPHVWCDPGKGMPSVVVVGGGIVGLATAYSLLRSRPGTPVLVVEKESTVAAHQSGHNSGVIHSGAYYRPGSEKARCCLLGRAMMMDFCREHGVEFRICGKLILATREDELPRLAVLKSRAQQNGVEGVRELTAAEIRKAEPGAAGVAALEVPTAGIVDYREVARALSERIERSGGQVLTGTAVTAVQPVSDGVIVETSRARFKAMHLVNCAGLYSDRVARMTGLEPGVRIVPFRGEYFWLRRGAAQGLQRLVYPVPDPELPFLGVHLTLSLTGRVEVGPNAVLAFAREGYRRESVSWPEAAEMFLFPGFWSMARRNLRTGAMENYRSLDRAKFASDVARLYPGIGVKDLEERGAGVRAQAVTPDGRLVDDFVIASGPASTHLLNAPSPAATSAFAIAQRLEELIPSGVG